MMGAWEGVGGARDRRTCGFPILLKNRFSHFILGATADLSAKMGALRILSQQRNKPNFGNGGAVANLVSTAVLRMQNRGI